MYMNMVRVSRQDKRDVTLLIVLCVVKKAFGSE